MPDNKILTPAQVNEADWQNFFKAEALKLKPKILE